MLSSQVLFQSSTLFCVGAILLYSLLKRVCDQAREAFLFLSGVDKL